MHGTYALYRAVSEEPRNKIKKHTKSKSIQYTLLFAISSLKPAGNARLILQREREREREREEAKGEYLRNRGREDEDEE